MQKSKKRARKRGEKVKMVQRQCWWQQRQRLVHTKHINTNTWIWLFVALRSEGCVPQLLLNTFASRSYFHNFTLRYCLFHFSLSIPSCCSSNTIHTKKPHFFSFLPFPLLRLLWCCCSFFVLTLYCWARVPRAPSVVILLFTFHSTLRRWRSLASTSSNKLYVSIGAVPPASTLAGCPFARCISVHSLIPLRFIHHFFCRCVYYIFNLHFFTAQ